MSTILVVEDESVIRVALRRLLERHDYEVSEAGSVQEAEQNHDLASFDLVISVCEAKSLIGRIPHRCRGVVKEWVIYCLWRAAIEGKSSIISRNGQARAFATRATTIRLILRGPTS